MPCLRINHLSHCTDYMWGTDGSRGAFHSAVAFDPTDDAPASAASVQMTFSARADRFRRAAENDAPYTDNEIVCHRILDALRPCLALCVPRGYMSECCPVSNSHTHLTRDPQPASMPSMIAPQSQEVPDHGLDPHIILEAASDMVA